MLGLSALATKAIAGALIAASLVSAWYGIKTHYYNQGWEAHENEVKAQNARALEEGRRGRSESDKCNDAGRTWNSADGVCQ